MLTDTIQAGDNLLFGGRTIKTLLESLLERPLNRWIFENSTDSAQMSGQILQLGFAIEPYG